MPDTCISGISLSVGNSRDLTVKLPYSFSLSQTLDCGQCFRWKAYKRADADEGNTNLHMKQKLRFADVGEAAFATRREGVGKNYVEQGEQKQRSIRAIANWYGVVGDSFVAISQLNDNTLVFHDTDLSSFHKLWKVYFDFERDYDGIKRLLARDAVLSKAIEFCGGIRVLRQLRWETLCSYIISQNNNIPRIKSLISKMCASFGNPIKRPDGTPGEDNSFPESEVLCRLTASDLEKLGFGYRAPYIICAAKAVASGDLNLDSVAGMPIDEARAELRKLTGVGPKVAECSLLYGFGREEAFPVDTWIKTVMSEFYPSGLPEFVRPYAGIAQIYLFHYIRNRSKEREVFHGTEQHMRVGGSPR